MKSALKKKKVYFGLHGFAYDNYFLSQMEITGGPLLDTYIVAGHSAGKEEARQKSINTSLDFYPKHRI